VINEPGHAHVELQVRPLDHEHAALLLWMASSGGRSVAGSTDLATDGTFLVAYVNGQPTGCGGYRVFPADPSGDTAEIAWMYVRPCSRRTGLARTIMRELERCAAYDGYRRVVVRFGDEQPGAHMLVGVTGYRRSTEYPSDQTGHIYGKDLHREEDSDSVP
jgi:GNAT superfamily N-acetyltransferase